MELSLIGLQNAGKSSLVNVLTTGTFEQDMIPTVRLAGHDKLQFVCTLACLQALTAWVIVPLHAYTELHGAVHQQTVLLACTAAWGHALLHSQNELHGSCKQHGTAALDSILPQHSMR
eukprot:359953-Chlamydomonas_euryale.AAC.5